MKQYFLLTLFMLTLHAQAQRVTNVTAEQQGQELLIHYHLEADGPVEVQLYLSTDRGSRWEGPLNSCAGDVGPNVAPGTGKHIRWNVLQDRELVGDGIAFKVVAKGGVKKEWLNPALTYGSVSDIDGNTYATIQIGKQVWMAENLRTARYRNGDPIPNVTGDRKWKGLSSGAWCHFRNDQKYELPYGKLYNWYAVVDRRGICPRGWHVPSDAEWTILINHLGGENMAGGKLKSRTLWDAPNTGATNGSGFTGHPGGYRSDGNGFFLYLGRYGYWWSASEIGTEYAWFRFLNYYNEGVSRYSNVKRNGFCLRCVRD
jgi:uncharacterized protein (TIGR02145 family)